MSDHDLDPSLRAVLGRVLSDLSAQLTEAEAAILVEDLARDYLQHLAERAVQGRLTEAHVKDTANKLDLVLRELAVSLVGELTPDRLEAYIERKRSQGRAARTLQEYARVIRAMVNHAVRVGRLRVNPLTGFRPPTAGADRRVREARALSLDEFRALVDAAAEWDSLGAEATGIPQAPLVYLAGTIGARFSELRRLDWGDLMPSASLLFVPAPKTKTKRARRVPLSDADLEALKSLRDACERRHGREVRSADPLFQSPRGHRLDQSQARRYLLAILERAGVQQTDEWGRHVGWGSLRKTAAMRMLRGGVPDATAASILGNSPATLRQWYHDHTASDLLEARERMSFVARPDAARPKWIGAVEAALQPPHSDEAKGRKVDSNRPPQDLESVALPVGATALNPEGGWLSPGEGPAGDSAMVAGWKAMGQPMQGRPYLEHASGLAPGTRLIARSWTEYHSLCMALGRVQQALEQGRPVEVMGGPDPQESSR